MFNNEDSKWYALFVMTGHEDNVRERLLYRLRDREIKALVPKRKLRERKDGIWKSQVRTLFPGYVLLNGRLGVEEYYSLKGIPDLITILKDKWDPLEIRSDEIEIISRLTHDNEIIGSSSAYIENGKVVVVNGPLKGLEGLIKSIDKRKGRVKVNLEFAGEPRLVDLCISVVQTT